MENLYDNINKDRETLIGAFYNVSDDNEYQVIFDSFNTLIYVAEFFNIDLAMDIELELQDLLEKKNIEIEGFDDEESSDLISIYPALPQKIINNYVLDKNPILIENERNFLLGIHKLKRSLEVLGYEKIIKYLFNYLEAYPESYKKLEKLLSLKKIFNKFNLDESLGLIIAANNDYIEPYIFIPNDNTLFTALVLIHELEHDYSERKRFGAEKALEETQEIYSVTAEMNFARYLLNKNYISQNDLSIVDKMDFQYLLSNLKELAADDLIDDSYYDLKSHSLATLLKFTKEEISREEISKFLNINCQTVNDSLKAFNTTEEELFSAENIQKVLKKY